MIKIKKSKFNNDLKTVYWLTGIKTDKHDTRHHIATINVDCGLAWKTNGAVLYGACVDFALNGHFEIVKRTKTEIWLNEVTRQNWPNVDSIFEAAPVNYQETLFDISIDHDCIGGCVADFYLAFNEDYRPKVNSQLVEHCLSGFDHVGIWGNDIDCPVIFIAPDLEKIAAVMPMRKIS
jgi:hypothetical protein